MSQAVIAPLLHVLYFYFYLHLQYVSTRYMLLSLPVNSLRDSHNQMKYCVQKRANDARCSVIEHNLMSY